jgi:thiamine biosynthesis lipoprotein
MWWNSAYARGDCRSGVSCDAEIAAYAAPAGEAVLPGLVLLALALTACERQPEMHQRLIPMFGTVAQVEILETDPQRAEVALDRIEALYLEFDRDWRSFGDGELGRVNAQLRAGRQASLSPPLARLVRRSLEFQASSAGLFDPRVGPLVDIWGFTDMAQTTPQDAPDDAAIARLRSQSLGDAVLHLEGGSVRSEAPVALDLNGLAEGAALRAGADLLAGLGVTDALIDTGGDLLALGRNGARPWRVGIRDPRGNGILATVELEAGEAVASSGSYERRFGPAGEYHHILDPRTGRPSTGSRGATVISRDPELADAAATALMIAGPERFDETARRMDVALALLVPAQGETLTTPGMRARLQWPARAPGRPATRTE